MALRRKRRVSIYGLSAVEPFDSFVSNRSHPDRTARPHQLPVACAPSRPHGSRGNGLSLGDLTRAQTRQQRASLWCRSAIHTVMAGVVVFLGTVTQSPARFIWDAEVYWSGSVSFAHGGDFFVDGGLTFRGVLTSVLIFLLPLLRGASVTLLADWLCLSRTVCSCRSSAFSFCRGCFEYGVRSHRGWCGCARVLLGS